MTDTTPGSSTAAESQSDMALIEGFCRKLRSLLSTKTVKDRRHQVRKFARYCATMGKDLFTADRPMVERYLHALDAGQPYRRETCNTLRVFFRFANVQPNPTTGIYIRVPAWRQPRLLPSQETTDAIVDGIVVRITEHALYIALRDRLMVELAYGSGLRRVELARLNVEDIDLADATAHVLGKGSKRRSVPLTRRSVDAAVNYLQVRSAQAGPLFISPGTKRRLHVTYISRVFKDRTGLTTHTFRHACATHLLQNGCDLRIIQELLGHTSIKATQFYTTVDKTDLAQSLKTAHPRSEK